MALSLLALVTANASMNGAHVPAVALAPAPAAVTARVSEDVRQAVRGWRCSAACAAAPDRDDGNERAAPPG